MLTQYLLMFELDVSFIKQLFMCDSSDRRGLLTEVNYTLCFHTSSIRVIVS